MAHPGKLPRVKTFLSVAILATILLIGGITYYLLSHNIFAGPQTYTDNVSALIQGDKEPYSFLHHLKNYEPDRLIKEGDLFSNWGLLSFRRIAGETSAQTVRRQILAIARDAGWTVEDELDLPIGNISIDWTSYGMKERPADLSIVKVLKGGNPPPRFSSAIWISEDGKRLLCAYRADYE